MPQVVIGEPPTVSALPGSRVILRAGQRHYLAVVSEVRGEDGLADLLVPSSGYEHLGIGKLCNIPLGRPGKDRAWWPLSGGMPPIPPPPKQQGKKRDPPKKTGLFLQ